jgi:prepilin-type N-terminal cleavage/methylation domain-containing protein
VSGAGFTLVELLLSVVIISLITGMSLPVYASFVKRNDLDLTAQSLVSALRRAQTYAEAVNYDSAWSVEVQASSVILFRGTSFGSRNTAFDETTSMPGTITPSGLGEIQFAKFTGVPNATGTITLTSNVTDTRVITINAKGMVDY